MLRAILVGAFSFLCLWQSSPVRAADETAPKTIPIAREEALARYNGLRAETPNTAAAQWKLALWCEEHELTVEARVHFGAVVTLDPKRDAAWKKLGFKKHGGKWRTDAQLAAAEEDAKASRLWAPKLKGWHKEIHGGKKQAEALAGVASITDPKAIPAVYREFGNGGTMDQRILIQILGQIDAPVATKTLAMMTIYGRSNEVRRLSTETLRQRPPEEFLDLLIAMMTDPLKYEVKPVGGPGSPGVLFVEGERFNVARFYAPPPPPTLAPQPGDMVTYDEFGMPVITRSLSIPTGQAQTQRLSGTATQTTQHNMRETVRLSASANLMEAQRAALAAQEQLASDVGRIDKMNQDITTFNDLVMSVAKDATGKDLGPLPKDWRAGLDSSPETTKKPKRKRTVNELVELDYNPSFNVFAPVSFMKGTTTTTVNVRNT